MIKKNKPPLLSKKGTSQKIKALCGWKLSRDRRSIEKEYLMKNFVAAVNFIRKITPIAEAADHHPDLHLTSYRKFKVVLSTHSAGGLTKKDFSLAAHIEKLPKTLKS